MNPLGILNTVSRGKTFVTAVICLPNTETNLTLGLLVWVMPKKDSHRLFVPDLLNPSTQRSLFTGVIR